MSDDGATAAAKGSGDCDPRTAVCYAMVKAERQWGECQKECEKCVKARAAYPEVTAARTLAAKDALNRAIMARLVRSAVGEGEPASVEAMLEQVVKMYRDEEGPEYALGWECTMNVEVGYNAAGLFGVAFNEYSYLGGAHPNSMTGSSSSTVTLRPARRD